MGLLSFMKKVEEKTWADGDLHLLRLIGNIIAGALIRKRIAEKLQASEAFFRCITDNMYDVITEVDNTGKRLYTSPSMEKLSGYMPAEMKGRTIFDLIHPDHVKEMTERTRVFMTARHPAPERREFRIRHRDGRYIWIEATSNPHLDGEGKVTGATICTRDISDRKRAEEELRILNEKLEQKVEERTRELARAVEELNNEIEAKTWLEDQLQQKNRELEDFTYMVSHELKNSLLSMQRVCEMPLLQPELAKGNFVNYTELCSRLITFIENLLILARSGKSLDQKKRVHLGKLVRNLFDRLAPRDGSVQLNTGAALPSLTCAPLGMEQVFSNLIVNAMEHRLEDPLVIDISCRWEKGSVIIMVKDNGRGLDEEERGAIFSIAYSNKPGSKFGFGLAIVKKIMEAHGGSVWAESPGKGKGTSFMLQLPQKRRGPGGQGVGGARGSGGQGV